MNTELRTTFKGIMWCIYKTWIEGTYDIPYKKKIPISSWTKSDGVFAEMQIISYIFIIL